MASLISVSSAPIAGYGDKEYYDLLGTLEVMKTIFRESVVDGFELQLEPEWDIEKPPVTDIILADWTKTPKYSAEEIVALVAKAKLPILSVHASRDVGNYLCSNREKDWERGRRVIHEALSIAEGLHSKVCVFHLWDTWKTDFDVHHIKRIFSDTVSQFPKVSASVENIPTHLKGFTPVELVRSFDFVTLDLRWAALYGELDSFESIVDTIVNVHMRGKLQGGRWFMDRSSFSFYEALDKIRRKWKYTGLLTMEPEGEINASFMKDFLKAMHHLRKPRVSH
jgi:hypothetical protein